MPTSPSMLDDRLFSSMILARLFLKYASGLIKLTWHRMVVAEISFSRAFIGVCPTSALQLLSCCAFLVRVCPLARMDL